MKYIGKLDDLPVYEFKRGAYVIVNPESEKVITTWNWLGNLGRNFDTFIKGGENPDDEKCVEVIEKNKDRIIKQVKDYHENAESDEGKEWLDEQDAFYDNLDEGREYDYIEGAYSDEL